MIPEWLNFGNDLTSGKKSSFAGRSQFLDRWPADPSATGRLLGTWNPDAEGKDGPIWGRAQARMFRDQPGQEHGIRPLGISAGGIHQRAISLPGSQIRRPTDISFSGALGGIRSPSQNHSREEAAALTSDLEKPWPLFDESYSGSWPE